MNYRSEIDGLRAIAVVSVLLYHSEIIFLGRDWFQGGFVGVDIFFVISGYLITRIIFDELQKTSKFNFLKFLERRARRILPALLGVISFCLPLSWFVLDRFEIVDFAKSILSTLAFYSNFYFFLSTTEYGTAPALLKPLLHTWSLSVEEQFYILFPIIMIIIWKVARSHLVPFLLILLIASFQFAETFGGINPELNFFFSLSRFWELLVGCLLAVIELKYGRLNNPLVVQTLPIFGLFLILHSITFFNPNIPHPGFRSLIPIIGVSFIIAFCSTSDFLGKALSKKPVVWVGLISYSLYLWHFPIFAFSRIHFAEPSDFEKLLLLALTVVLSVASYLLIEKPFRDRQSIGGSFFVGIVGLAMTCLLLASITIILNGGFRVRPYSNMTLSPNIEYINLTEKRRYTAPICVNELFDDTTEVPIQYCDYGDLEAENILHAMGDSHLQALHQSFNDFGIANGIKIRQYELVGCSALVTNVPRTTSQNDVLRCKETLMSLAQKIKNSGGDVILSFRWMVHLYPIDNYKLDSPTKNEDGISERSAGAYTNYFAFNDGSYTTNSSDKFRALDFFIRTLANGSERLFFFKSVPEVSYDIYEENRKFWIESYRKNILETISISHHEYKLRNLFISDFLNTYRYPNLTIIDVESIFCDSFIKDRCVAQFETVPFFYDDDHLSKVGADLVIDQFEKIY